MHVSHIYHISCTFDPKIVTLLALTLFLGYDYISLGSIECLSQIMIEFPNKLFNLVTLEFLNCLTWFINNFVAKLF
jgi:hypothetical protein